jgi:hypothetical protein
VAQQAKILKPNSNSDMPRISNPADFPSPGEPITVELSTGRVIEMVIGELEMFYERGDVPDDLTAIAARSLVYVEEAEEPIKVRAQRGIDAYRLAVWLATQVVKRGGPVGNFYRSEIWDVWKLANTPALALANFRRQQARHVEIASSLRDVPADAEPTPAGIE